MIPTTFELDLANGFARPATQPPSARSVPWTEAQLQHVLVLNPDLLDVADEVPLELTGGTHCRIPDQTYVDAFGRVTVVEVKNERANLGALAQLLSYADHWRMAPLGEMLPDFKMLAHEGQGSVLAGAIRSLSSLAGRTVGGGRARVTRVPVRWTAWPDPSRDSVVRFVEATWGPAALALSGAPVRAVLIAPSFDEPVLELAAAVNGRSGQIELIRADLWRLGPKRIGLTWAPLVVPDPAVANTWRLAGRIWGNAAIRSEFSMNGWADALNAKYFSFSSRRAPDAKFWIRADGSGAELFTVVPDKWGSGSARAQLRRRFLAALPDGHAGGRWIEWCFSLPKQAKRLDFCASRVARAIVEVLAPAQP